MNLQSQTENDFTGKRILVTGGTRGIGEAIVDRLARGEGAAEVQPSGRIKSNFLCNLGYGDPKGLHPRGPRLAFDEACKLL